jgi:hypothetical protein
MTALESPLDLTIEELAAARAIGIAAVLRDLLASEEQLHDQEAAIRAAAQELRHQEGGNQQTLKADALEESVFRVRQELEQRSRDAAALCVRLR